MRSHVTGHETLWHRLVMERGWTNERFAEWLGNVWVDRLVTQHPR